jgi:hypothetical protein
MAEIINNYLSPTNFTVNVQRIPNIEFFVQKLSIPSLSATPSARDTPLNVLYDINDKLTYADLEMTFIIDENMNNYKEILDWLEGISGSTSTNQNKQLGLSKYGFKSDIIATITNSHKNPNTRFIFRDCFPTGLGSVELDVNVQDVSYATCSVTMRYDIFTMEQL